MVMVMMGKREVTMFIRLPIAVSLDGTDFSSVRELFVLIASRTNVCFSTLIFLGDGGWVIRSITSASRFGGHDGGGDDVFWFVATGDVLLRTRSRGDRPKPFNATALRDRLFRIPEWSMVQDTVF
jgi:hypothetical protein